MKEQKNKSFLNAVSAFDETKLSEIRRNSYQADTVTVGKMKYPVISGYPVEAAETISCKLKYLITGMKN